MEGNEFKKLKKLWYQKLKEDGFDDIEDTSSKNEYLKVWDSHCFLRRTENWNFIAKMDYFIMANRYLINYNFQNDLEKDIWRLHTEGLSLREIARELRMMLSRVRTTVTRHRDFMLGRI